ncbi:MAG TPA: patatin-like phospholipase family protein [Casimicrobiaceae bacterium]|nr:patatin-like phospholipase family protein [Casimicrobiaceae bacterium]
MKSEPRNPFVSQPGCDANNQRPLGTFAAFVCIVFFGSGCVSTYRPSINQALDSPTVSRAGIAAHRWVDSVPANSSGLMLIVSFSGGGTRAAALSYGILDKLKSTAIKWDGRDTTLLNEIDVISGVSGGSITAAYFAAFGDQTFKDFKPKFLNRDFESDLISGALDPANSFHLTSPWYGRGDLLADQLDGLLFHGMNYGGLLSSRPRPALIITATDLSLGTSFEFTERQFHQICSNIDAFPLARAVAASNSVPILFTPITLKNYAGSCPAEASPATQASQTEYSDRRERRYVEEQNTYQNLQERPYIHLVDGGLADNLGIKRIIDGIASSGGLPRSLQSRGIRGIRKLVFLNVDAGRRNSFAADRVDSIPSSMEVARGIQFGLLSRYAAETNDAFAEEVEKWRREIRIAASEGDGPFAADAELYYIEVGLRNYANQATRAELLAIPTAYTLDEKQVEELINAGREILDANTEFRRLLTDLTDSAHPGEDEDSVQNAR